MTVWNRWNFDGLRAFSGIPERWNGSCLVSPVREYEKIIQIDPNSFSPQECDDSHLIDRCTVLPPSNGGPWGCIRCRRGEKWASGSCQVCWAILKIVNVNTKASLPINVVTIIVTIFIVTYQHPRCRNPWTCREETSGTREQSRLQPASGRYQGTRRCWKLFACARWDPCRSRGVKELDTWCWTLSLWLKCTFQSVILIEYLRDITWRRWWSWRWGAPRSRPPRYRRSTPRRYLQRCSAWWCAPWRFQAAG